MVRPHAQKIMEITPVCGTLDLSAGQVVDRVGGMLGLQFPAGKELEQLALTCDTQYPVKVKLKGMNCCLSGVENQCRNMLEKGAAKNEVAKYSMDFICATVQAMSEAVMLECGEVTRVYAGGVASSSMVRDSIGQWLGGVFATPELSSDNAVGTAVLAWLRSKRC